MITRQIDQDGDWTFGAGRNNYVSGTRGVVQNIKTRLNSFLGDCFFDLSAGIDWFTFCSSKDVLSLRLAISAVILNTADVTGIDLLNVSLSATTRNFLVQFTVETVYSRASSTFQFDLNPIG